MISQSKLPKPRTHDSKRNNAGTGARKTLVIVNPTSGGGAGRRRWPSIKKLLEEEMDAFDVEVTGASGDARKIAAQAASEGYSLVIACGGDGTVHEVTNGIRDAGVLQKTALGILSVGTGGDFVKTLEIPKDMREQVRTITRGRDRTIDLGKITYAVGSGKNETRHFINVASAGLGAEVIRRIHRSRALFGRKLAYLASTLESYFAWSPSPVVIETDGASKTPLPEKPLIIVIANGRYFGGGMPIAPGADPSDGYLDLVVVGRIKPLKIPLALSLLYSKRFHNLSEVYYDRVRSVTVTPKSNFSKRDDGVGLDIDGELIGSLPATFQIVPQALKVRVPRTKIKI